MASIVARPDSRPTEIVKKYFDEDFAAMDFPNVSWALGSDWGWGLPAPKDAADYRKMAEARFAMIYGE